MKTEYKVFLPYGKLKDEVPLHWLCYYRSKKKLKGSFFFMPVEDGSNIYFDEKEDMQLFILMWGKYL